MYKYTKPLRTCYKVVRSLKKKQGARQGAHSCLLALPAPGHWRTVASANPLFLAPAAARSRGPATGRGPPHPAPTVTRRVSPGADDTTKDTTATVSRWRHRLLPGSRWPPPGRSPSPSPPAGLRECPGAAASPACRDGHGRPRSPRRAATRCIFAPAPRPPRLPPPPPPPPRTPHRRSGACR